MQAACSLLRAQVNLYSTSSDCAARTLSLKNVIYRGSNNVTDIAIGDQRVHAWPHGIMNMALLSLSTHLQGSHSSHSVRSLLLGCAAQPWVSSQCLRRALASNGLIRASRSRERARSVRAALKPHSAAHVSGCDWTNTQHSLRSTALGQQLPCASPSTSEFAACIPC